ncbi:unnamed protein product, partial [Meganyctiphanes norvegica]
DSSIACSICLEEYNDTNRRPKALPCAHNLCLRCLENCIALTVNKCGVCRKPFAATSVGEIPFNTDLEKLIRYVSQLTQGQQGTGGLDSPTSTIHHMQGESANKSAEDLKLACEEGLPYSLEDEEEQLQLALAISYSEAEPKEREEASGNSSADGELHLAFGGRFSSEEEDLELALALSKEYDVGNKENEEAAHNNNNADGLEEEGKLLSAYGEGLLFYSEEEELQLILEMSKFDDENKDREEVLDIRSAEELQEEEELQLALAMSTFEFGNKERKGDSTRENSEEKCIFCYYDLDDEPSIQLDCGHSFHDDCIRRLLETSY